MQPTLQGDPYHVFILVPIWLVIPFASMLPRVVEYLLQFGGSTVPPKKLSLSVLARVVQTGAYNILE